MTEASKRAQKKYVEKNKDKRGGFKGFRIKIECLIEQGYLIMTL